MEKDSRRRMLAAYLNALADLAGPKCAMPTLRDAPRLDAYSDAMRRVLLERPGDGHAQFTGLSRHHWLRRTTLASDTL